MSDDPYRVRSGAAKNRNVMVVAIMAVVVIALAAVAWNTYGGATGPVPVVSADGAFKTVAPAPESTSEDTRDVYNMIEAAKGAPAPIAVSAAQVGEAPVAPTAPPAPAAPIAPAAGGFLVQLGALRTPDAAETAWAKLDSAHPGLLRGVRKDVQRAELGADGVYYRLRAGYFDDRAKAVSFCERVKGAGLACMVVVR